MTNLILGDSKEELKKLKSNSIDIIITDPPYGIGYGDYDDSNIFFELETEMYRLLKDNSWFIFWWSIKQLPNISKLKNFQYVWQLICEFPSTYSKSIIGDRKYCPVMVFSKGKPKICYRRQDILLAQELPIVYSKLKSGDFKPTIALSQLLILFTKENDMILDPFMGYGSLGIVCKLFHRNYIGIEKNEIRYKIANKIIEEGKIIKSIPEMEKDFLPISNSLF